MLRGGDEHGHMWRVACVCVYGGHTQAQTRGSVLDSHGLSGKDTVPLSLSFYLVLSQACGLLSCEHTTRIKDLFISVFGLSFAS